MSYKVCHLTSVHPIEDVRIFEKECTSLALSGFDVTLIACGEMAFEDIKNGVKRVSLFIPVKNRFQRMTILVKAIYSKALQVDADIYHFHDPELLPIGLKLKHIGKKVIYDAHEDTPTQIRSKSWIPNIFRNVLSYSFSFYENRVAKKLDAIISVTPLIVNRFKIINTNTYQITNFPEVEYGNVEGTVGRNNICFAGKISNAYLFDKVLTALSRTTGVRLLLAGKPESCQYLNKLKSLNGWTKVDYLGTLQYAEVKELYIKSLIGIVCLGYLPSVGYKVGTLGVLKLFEYMSAGMAVICTDLELWKEIVEKNNCGLCVNPYDIDAISIAIQYLVDNPDIAIEMGRNGRRAIEREYNWSTQKKVLIELYDKLSN